ncbi:MAG: LysR substrate-binding domain-containing protein [Stellaceae bacterium]
MTDRHGSELAEIAKFVVIAEHRSFSKAASELGVSVSTLSKTLRSLEERLDIRLFNRTTRRVVLTEAGQQLLIEVRPALNKLQTAVENVGALRNTPAGLLRLNVSSLAATMVISPILGPFAKAYPAVRVDISVKDGPVDIVGGHFDAGIRRDRRIERDMVSIRISHPARILTVASPEYVTKHLPLKTPDDLHAHNCIRFRLADGTIARWEFERAGRKQRVRVDGSLIVDNVDLMLCGALAGIGIAYTLEPYVRPLIDASRLVPVLEEWSPCYSGWHIYYPSRRQMRAPLKVFIDFVRHQPRD